MQYYRKLNLRFAALELANDPSRLVFHNAYKTPQKYGLRLQKNKPFISVPNLTYKLREEDAQHVVSDLPKKLLELEVPEVWVLNICPTDSDEPTMLAPHRDIVRMCGINIYFDTHGERTIYYECENNKIAERDSFVAKDGECYVLDLDAVHAVELVPPHVRKAVSISFIRTPYREVVRYL